MDKKEKVSSHGHRLLKELEADRRNFRDKKIDVKEAQTLAILANSTSRVMRETINSKKFELAFTQ